MRHWGRFEQFRRPATRADMIRPELLFRDPAPRPGRLGGTLKAVERDFVFLRIKERFLVPDHTVKDISGASFAGRFELSPVAGRESLQDRFLLCHDRPEPDVLSVRPFFVAYVASGQIARPALVAHGQPGC
jgi:hypothetical protein